MRNIPKGTEGRWLSGGNYPVRVENVEGRALTVSGYVSEGGRRFERIIDISDFESVDETNARDKALDAEIQLRERPFA